VCRKACWPRASSRVNTLRATLSSARYFFFNFFLKNTYIVSRHI
jgi:hypothetical protein